MTEKRYNFKESKLGFDVYDGNFLLNAIEIVNRLNEQDIEIDNLKRQIDDLTEFIVQNLK